MTLSCGFHRPWRIKVGTEPLLPVLLVLVRSMSRNMCRSAGSYTHWMPFFGVLYFCKMWEKREAKPVGAFSAHPLSGIIWLHRWQPNNTLAQRSRDTCPHHALAANCIHLPCASESLILKQTRLCLCWWNYNCNWCEIYIYIYRSLSYCHQGGGLDCPELTNIVQKLFYPDCH